MSADNDYQTVTLILADGRRVTFTGRVQLDDADRVVGIEVGLGRGLPDGCRWERLPAPAGEQTKEGN